MGEHISDEVLAAWAEGSVAPTQISAVTAHVAICQTCRRLLSELTRETVAQGGRKVGRYELRERVGAGGMGTVWAAWDAQLARRVAVKIAHLPSPALADGARRGGTERFMHERQVLAALEHPHIARLLDAGETDEYQPWFAMDFVDGAPIDVYCARHALSVRQTVELMLPVIEAIDHAHQHLVVHRDVKPPNILVDGAGRAHLVDFGIALMLEGDLRLTQTGQTPMTPAWASPEQVLGQRLSVRTDIYSLGVVLYELLARASPYGQPQGVEGLLAAIREGHVAPMSQLARARGDAERANALEGDLDAVVGMALRKEPQARYASAAALAEDLRAALEGGVTSARRDDRRYRVQRFLKRNRVAVGSAVAIVAALAMGLGVAAWQATVARAEAARAERRFAQVRSLAHSVLFDYHDGIADLPGSTALRERLVKDALGYLDSLASEAQGDVTLQRELAMAYLKVGDAQGYPFASNLGDTDGAAKSYQRSRELAAQVLARMPSDRDALRTAALNEHRAGAIAEVAGKLDDALKGYQRAATALSAVLSLDANDVESRSDLSGALLGQSYVHSQLGDLAKALSFAESAARERHEVSTRNRTAEHLAAEAAALLARADALEQLGRVDEAIAVAEEATASAEAARALDAESTYARRALLKALSLLARLKGVRGDRAAAADVLQRVVAENRAMLQRDPDDIAVRRDLVFVLVDLARELGALARYSEGLAATDEATRTIEALMARDESGVLRRDLLVVLLREAYLAIDSKDWVRARGAFSRARSVGTEALRGDEKNASVLDVLVDAANGLGEVALERKELATARREAELAVELANQLADATPEDVRLRSRTAFALTLLAKVQTAQGEREKGCQTAKTAIGILEPLMAEAKVRTTAQESLDEARALCAR